MDILSRNIPSKRGKSGIAMIALATLLSFSACDSKQEKTQTQTIDQSINDITTNNIPMTREYKIYKLQLNSIVNIKYDIQKAQQKVNQKEELTKILNKEDLSIHTLLPQTIKESNMNNSKTSKSGAQGYMQIMDSAIEEIYRVYDISGIKLDKNDPIDNIILGGLYRKLVYDKIELGMKKRGVKISEQDIESLAIISYNIGITRLFEHIDISESKSIDELMQYFAKYIGISYNKKTQIDPTYKIQYTDIFGGEKIAENASWEKKKIYEGCRYENVIHALDTYIQEKEDMQIITTIILQKKETLFSKIQEMKKNGIFLQTASVNDICKIILGSNGFRENQTPTQVPLHLIYEPLQTFLK